MLALQLLVAADGVLMLSLALGAFPAARPAGAGGLFRGFGEMHAYFRFVQDASEGPAIGDAKIGKLHAFFCFRGGALTIGRRLPRGAARKGLVGDAEAILLQFSGRAGNRARPTQAGTRQAVVGERSRLRRSLAGGKTGKRKAADPGLFGCSVPWGSGSLR